MLTSYFIDKLNKKISNVILSLIFLLTIVRESAKECVVFSDELIKTNFILITVCELFFCRIFINSFSLKFLRISQTDGSINKSTSYILHANEWNRWRCIKVLTIAVEHFNFKHTTHNIFLHSVMYI